MSFKKEEEDIPLLLYFLEHAKYDRIVKLIFNPKLAEEYLTKYGDVPKALTRAEDARLDDYVRRFNVRDVTS